MRRFSSRKLTLGVSICALVAGLELGWQETFGREAVKDARAKEIFERYEKAIFHVRIIESLVGDRDPITTFGTGFLVSKSGHIITAGHVIPTKTAAHRRIEISVRQISTSADYFPASLVPGSMWNPALLDVAVLRVDHMPNWKMLCFGYSNLVVPGTKLYVIGHHGERRALPGEGSLMSVRGRDIAYWETDLPTDHGFSGAPVFLESGAVVGIVVEPRQDPTGRQQKGTNVVPEELFRDMRVNFSMPLHCGSVGSEPSAPAPPGSVSGGFSAIGESMATNPCATLRWLPCAHRR